MKLILGTAQFGFKYGYKKIKIKNVEMEKIQTVIKKNKIFKFDTAINYIDSENIIGNFKVKKEIITKIKLPDPKPLNLNFWFENTLSASFKKLKVKKLYGLLIHDTSDLLYKDKELLKLIQIKKKKKLVSKLGISVYEPSEIRKTLKFWKPDIIQMPVNIFDHRFLKKNFLDKLKNLNIELHARSCFLQGRLLEKKLKIGNFKTKKIFSSFANWCKKNQLSKLDACLHFVKKISQIDYIIIGFDNSFHLKEIVDSFNKKLVLVSDNFVTYEKNFIDPRKWKIN